MKKVNEIKVSEEFQNEKSLDIFGNEIKASKELEDEEPSDPFMIVFQVIAFSVLMGLMLFLLVETTKGPVMDQIIYFQNLESKKGWFFWKRETLFPFFILTIEI